MSAAAALTLAALGSVSCGKVVREGTSPAYLVIDALQAKRGGSKDDAAHYLESDVVTVVKKVPTVFEDSGIVTMHLQLKDIGNPASPTEPSQTNYITVNRYRVDYLRSDGRNTQGVDVPYGFDGAATGTIGKSSTAISFVLVRAQSKLEAPLSALAGGGGALLISTIAKVTFYGQDQAGNAVSVTGQISVNFADWGDPE